MIGGSDPSDSGSSSLLFGSSRLFPCRKLLLLLLSFGSDLTTNGLDADADDEEVHDDDEDC